MVKDKKKLKKELYIAASVILALLLIACEIWRKELFGVAENSEELYFLSTRIIGGLFALLLIFFCGYQNILKIDVKTIGTALLFTLPCWLIPINNFPIISYFSGNASIDAPVSAVIFYAFQCLCVAFFEELAFRGCIFMFILQGRRRSMFDLFTNIVISAAAFGVIHAVNLFSGASPMSVILQVGYAFLIGGMYSVVLMKTGSVWHCVMMHAVYNFCGGVVPELGHGEIWNTPTIILTVIVSLAVAAYVIISLVRIDPNKLGYIFNEKNDKMKTE